MCSANTVAYGSAQRAGWHMMDGLIELRRLRHGADGRQLLLDRERSGEGRGIGKVSVFRSVGLRLECWKVCWHLPSCVFLYTSCILIAELWLEAWLAQFMRTSHTTSIGEMWSFEIRHVVVVMRGRIWAC